MLGISCSDIFGPEEGYSISGKITDMGTLKPLTNCIVFIRTPEEAKRETAETYTTTDGKGKYAFKNLSNGQYELFCDNRTGYWRYYFEPHIAYVEISDASVKDVDFRRWRS